jgi:hypothetical protein
MVKRPTAVQRKMEDQAVQDEPQRVRPQWLMKNAVDVSPPGDAGHSEFSRRMLDEARSPRERGYVWNSKSLRPVLPVSHIDDLDKGYQTRRHQLSAAQEARPKLYKQIAVAAIAAMTTGALAGLVVYEHAHNGALTKTAMQWAGERIFPAQHRKELSTAKLAVADMTAAPNLQMPLPIALETTRDRPVSVRLTGLPDTAYLTVGKRIDNAVWLVSSDELQRAKLAFHETPASPFSLSVAAVEAATGTLAAPIQEMKIDISLKQDAENSQTGQTFPLSTVSAKADFNAYPSKQTAVDELLARADALLQAGKIDDARRLYTQANSLSASDALLGLAKTYDPDFLAKLNVKNAKPDSEMALAYYRKAEAAGAAGAKEAIEALQRTAK